MSAPIPPPSAAIGVNLMLKHRPCVDLLTGGVVDLSALMSGDGVPDVLAHLGDCARCRGAARFVLGELHGWAESWPE